IKIYRIFRLKLAETFSFVKTVDFVMTYHDSTIDAEKMCHYWQDFIEAEPDLLPAFADLLKNQQPDVDGQKLIIKTRNEAEASVIKNRITPAYRAYCQKTGIPCWPLEFIVYQAEENLAKFNEQKA